MKVYIGKYDACLGSLCLGKAKIIEIFSIRGFSMMVYDSAVTMTAVTAEAARAAEGRWPRICERACDTAAQWARCGHVL